MMVLGEENTSYRVEILKEEIHASVLNHHEKRSFLKKRGRRKSQ